MTSTLKTLGRLSLRETSTISNDPRQYYEIVQWFDYNYEDKTIAEGSTCYTIAIFRSDKEGPNLHFTGSRPFELDEYEVSHFWNLAKYGQTVLEANFSFNQTTKEL